MAGEANGHKVAGVFISKARIGSVVNLLRFACASQDFTHSAGSQHDLRSLAEPRVTLDVMIIIRALWFELYLKRAFRIFNSITSISLSLRPAMVST
jgi:hypothetical protein